MTNSIIKYALYIILLFTLSSCHLLDFLKDDEKEEPIAKQLLIVDTENETPFDCVLFNEDNYVTSFFNLDENDVVRQAIIKFNETDEALIVLMSEDGRIESIGNSDCTLSINYKDGNYIDVAVIFDDNSYIFENITAPDESIEALSRAGFDDVANWVEGTPLNRGLYRFSELFGGAISVFTEPYYLNINNVTEKEAIKAFSKMVYNAFGYIPNESFLIDSYNVASIFSHTPLGVWGNVLNLIANYSSYVDWCEQVFSYILPLLDKHKEEANLGLGALKSGIGQLKATLTWSFYADIDLHAFEPSGTHIYFGDKRGDFGYLDYDNRNGGSGATENIYWQSPAPGEYEFYINYYGRSAYNGLSQSGTCHVSIYYNNQGQKFDIPISSGVAYVAKVTITSNSRGASTPDVILQPIATSNHTLRKIRAENKPESPLL